MNDVTVRQADRGHTTADRTVENTVRINSDSCAKIRDLGYTPSKHIRMYGEHFEIVSDPFNEGGCVAVRATSGGDPAIRILRLPAAILVGQSDRFLKRPSLAVQSTS